MQSKDKPVKVLHVIDHTGPGGAQVLLTNILPALAKDSFSITLVVLGRKRGLVEDLENKGITIIPLNIHKYGVFQTLKRVKQIIKELNPTIVHTHLDKSNLFAAYLASKEKVPVVIRHDHSSTWPPLPSYFFWRRLIEKLGRFQTEVIAVSEAVRKFNLAAGVSDNKITVIHNGIDLKRFSTDKKRLSYPVIGYVGRLHFKKGVKYLIKALPLVAKEKPDVKLFIVGDGPQKKELLKLCQGIGLKDNVVFFGNRKDVQKFYRLFDVFVLPSLFEACPLALMEAMASGCPVVASNLGGITEIVTDKLDGLIFQARDSQMLAEKILCLLNNPKYASALTKQAVKKVAQQFDVSLTNARMVQFYNNLLAKVV